MLSSKTLDTSEKPWSEAVRDWRIAPMRDGKSSVDVCSKHTWVTYLGSIIYVYDLSPSGLVDRAR